MSLSSNLLDLCFRSVFIAALAGRKYTHLLFTHSLLLLCLSLLVLKLPLCLTRLTQLKSLALINSHVYCLVHRLENKHN